MAPESDAHLTLRQVEDLARVQEAEPEAFRARSGGEHWFSCTACQSLVGAYQALDMLKEPIPWPDEKPHRSHPGPAKADCPKDDVWWEVAAGSLDREAASRNLQHASSCERCSILLRRAIADLSGHPSPEEEERLASLESVASDAWLKKMADRMAASSRPRFQVAAGRAIRWSLPGRSWVPGLAAVLAIAVSGIVLVTRGPREDEAAAMLRQVYMGHRTVEARLPGFGYGPIRQERAGGTSETGNIPAFLEAKGKILGALEKTPNDPALLRRKAEADLMEGDYPAAIEILNGALRNGPQSAPLLADLGAAYFENAEASHPEDYPKALENLGEALRISPQDTAALFNRARVQEKMALYGPAIADWKQLLAMERDSGWKGEEQKRLNELLSRKRTDSGDAVPPGDIPGDIKALRQALEKHIPVDAEVYLSLAERELLPVILASHGEGENYKLARELSQDLAKDLSQVHHDPFLRDMLQGIHAPGFQRAAKLLGEAVEANRNGRHDQAGSAAREAERAFGAAIPAGAIAAQFEQAYALQLESRAVDCVALASRAAAAAQLRGYAWLQAQSLLEEAMCLDMGQQLEPAKDRGRRAMQLAEEHGYRGFLLRGMMEMAELEAKTGNEPRAWYLILDGLSRYWEGGFLAVRGYSFYALMDFLGERSGRPYVQLAAGEEALGFLSSNPNGQVAAAQRFRVANLALRLGDASARETFSALLEQFKKLPPSPARRSRELEAKIALAKVEAMDLARLDSALSDITSSAPELREISNLYMHQEYYATLGEIRKRRGENEAARAALSQAISLADQGLGSLRTADEKLAWVSQNSRPYMLLTELQFASGDPAEALTTWRHFRTAPFRRSAGTAARPSARPHPVAWLQGPSSAAPESPSRNKQVLAYAQASDGILVWVCDGAACGGPALHSAYVRVSAGELARTAGRFIEACSRPDSNLENLRADAHRLYGWIIEPVRRWLPERGELIVEPDSAIGALPLQALVDDAGEYLGERYSISMAPTFLPRAAQENGLDAAAVQPEDRALIVASEVLPDTEPEAEEIAGQFRHPVRLKGGEATIRKIQEEMGKSAIFHFAGHAVYDRQGAALLLADGILNVSEVQRNWDKPRRLKLAVFSACATARPGEDMPGENLVMEFLNAGTSRVVASRWNVDSASTADFMASFYDSMVREKHSVAGALRLAAQAMRSAHSHPYYWAAFSVYESA